MDHVSKDESPSPKTDNFFIDIGNYIADHIQRFVAFLFFLVAIGTFYGFFIASADPGLQPFLLMAPLLVGLLAYYNRAFALFAFVLLALFVVIL